MDYDRLRELQAKFDENPRRYFAPLANEYRKGGNPKRAIEICRAHLAQMPGHMSGQVVFGQALFEGGEYEEARKVFEGALVLDPENLIALRSLGDLSLQAGDTVQARSWYKRLLEADPKDAAVIALIAAIDAPPATAGEEPATSSELNVDYSFVDQAPTAGAPPLGLEHHYPTADTAADDAASEARATSSPAPEPAAENFGEPPAPMGPDRDALDWSQGPAETGGATPAASGNDDARATEDASQTSSFVGTNPEPFVNETMAQLYLQQGYKQLALRVYRQLSERKPEDQALKDRIAEIEASQAAGQSRAQPEARREEAPSVESPTPEPAAPRAPSTESPLPHGPGSQPSSIESPGGGSFPVDSPPSSPSPSSEPDSIESPVREEPRAEPEGIAARQPSMKEFFATLGRRRPAPPVRPNAPDPWRPEASAPAGVPAAPANPESLDAVFAGAKVSAKDARAASTLAGAFSATARATSPPLPPAIPTPRANPRLQTQESEEDVAKFRAWLDGLTGE
ncbi:MAG TPA: tetratricopeptide repeat protein [Gemmatimonadaceae bacterium]|nr:tetratricopeptide repeat protein [Gemmatimonadaceae bacterium]